MYQRILVPVEHSEVDQVILQHIRKLARTCNDASIVLIHVADGWAARNINQLDLRESEEMKSDREYIEAIADDLEKDGYQAEAILAGGDPAKEIVHLAWAAPGSPYYTPYGPLRQLTLSEGGHTTIVPAERIGHIEDFWPDLITLRSQRVGDYELTIPQGIPIAVPEVISIRAGRFTSIHTAESSYPPPPKQQ